MDKEWVERTIEAKTWWKTLSTLEMTQEPVYDKAAEAIAQAHEAELTEDKKLIGDLQNQVEILTGLVDEATDAGNLDLSSGAVTMLKLDAAKAKAEADQWRVQVVVMGEVLGRIQDKADLHITEGVVGRRSDWAGVSNWAHAALASAPEVTDALAKWEEAGQGTENQLILEVTGLRALVAGMATELECIANVIEEGCDFHETDVAEIRRLALASAPEVLWHGVLRDGPDMMPEDLEQFYEAIDERGITAVDVFVLARPQGQDSKQEE